MMSRTDLFLKGAERYLDAAVAIQAFKKEAQDACEKVYKRHATALASQMGLENEEAKPHAYEDEPSVYGVELGVWRPAQKGGCSFYIILRWLPTESNESKIEAVIDLDVYGKRSRDEMFAQLKRKNKLCKVVPTSNDWFMLELVRPIKTAELATIDTLLDGLVLEWLEYCKSVGGLRLNRPRNEWPGRG